MPILNLIKTMNLLSQKFEIKEEPAKFEAKTTSPEPYDPNESVLLNISAAAKR